MIKLQNMTATGLNDLKLDIKISTKLFKFKYNISIELGKLILDNYDFDGKITITRVKKKDDNLTAPMFVMLP